jgi:hypothetical protein
LRATTFNSTARAARQVPDPARASPPCRSSAKAETAAAEISKTRSNKCKAAADFPAAILAAVISVVFPAAMPERLPAAIPVAEVTEEEEPAETEAPRTAEEARAAKLHLLFFWVARAFCLHFPNLKEHREIYRGISRI